MKRFKKWKWPVLKWRITQSLTIYVKNWRLRRLLNALLVPIYLLRHITTMLSRKVIFPQISLVLTRRCVLSCKDCAALSPLFRKHERQDIPINDIMLDLDRVLSVVDGIENICLAGGEPFLYPHLVTIVQRVILDDRIKSVRLYSTGTPTPSDVVLRVLAHPKVFVGLSTYGNVSKHLDATLRKLHEFGVVHRVENNAWNDFGPIQKNNRTIRELRRQFSKCWQRECFVVVNGELHYCFRSAYGTELGLSPKVTGDRVDLSQSPEIVRFELYRFMGLDYTFACTYCKGCEPLAERGRQ